MFRAWVAGAEVPEVLQSSLNCPAHNQVVSLLLVSFSDEKTEAREFCLTVLSLVAFQEGGLPGPLASTLQCSRGVR